MHHLPLPTRPCTIDSQALSSSLFVQHICMIVQYVMTLFAQHMAYKADMPQPYLSMSEEALCHCLGIPLTGLVCSKT